MPRLSRGVAIAGGLLLMLGGQAQAGTLVVSQTDDPAPTFCVSGISCSLREAVGDANNDSTHPGADTIELPPGTYTLTGDALPTVIGDITIEGRDGAGATTITGADTAASASPTGGVIAVDGTGAKLTIRGVTISGNRLTGTASVGGGAIAAGGHATLAVERSVLRHNRTEAASSGVGGGAIAGVVDTLNVTDSAIEDNVYAGTQPGAGGNAGAGGIANDSGAVQILRSSISRNRGDLVNIPNTSVVGGLNVNSAGSLVLTDSTVSGNSVTSGGVLFRVGGLQVNGSIAPVTLTNVTLTDNVTSGSGSQVHGNLASFTAPTMTIRNTIVAGGFPDNCKAINSTIASSGGNVEDANTCAFTGPGDLINTDPQLGGLDDNGGLGLTQAPGLSSPVFGLARSGFCSASDERGIARPQGGACDSGAFEGATPPVNTTPPSISGTPASGQTLTCNPGAFTQAPTLAFQWLSDGAGIPGATASTFTVTSAQLDTAVQCQVTATNVGGRTVATSAAVKPAAPRPPVNTARPSFRGILRTGQRLTCARGAFTGATSFAFAWLRNGTPIRGARTSTYTLTAADAGKALQCRVTATGPGGSIVAESRPAVPAKACIVPALTGRTLAAARKRLTRANCALGRTTKRKSTRRPGLVLASSPARGRNLPAGSRIALTISKR